jgi:hypothetical protein
VAEAADLAWLVRNRNAVQVHLLKLHARMESATNAGTTGESDLLLLILGASFSLWRAVFLVQKVRPRPSMYAAAAKFLTTLLRDNAINYKQDLDSQAWTAGYYLNNAASRLRNVFKALDVSPSVNQHHRVYIDRWVEMGGLELTPTKLCEAWEATFAACDHALDVIISGDMP